MITLYGWGPMFDCPSPSPFVMKADIQLQMLGVDFDRAIADLSLVSGETLVPTSLITRRYASRFKRRRVRRWMRDLNV